MYAGAWDTIQNIISTVGVTPASMEAIIKAFTSPTLTNIDAVKKAFAAAGTTPPPELLNVLYGRYYDSIATSPYYTTGMTMETVGDWLPWIVGGGLLLFAVAKRRR